ncbi:hypothetical protein ABNF65_21070 [Paenibacillus larvae]
MSVDIPMSLISIRRIQQLNESDFELRREIEFHEEKIEEHQIKVKKIREALEYNQIEKEFHKKLAHLESGQLPRTFFPYRNQRKQNKILSEKKLALKKALENVFLDEECLNIRVIIEKIKSHGIEWKTYALAFQELTKSGFLIRQERGMYELYKD